jgi:ankyrin repeat protein
MFEKIIDFFKGFFSFFAYWFYRIQFKYQKEENIRSAFFHAAEENNDILISAYLDAGLAEHLPQNIQGKTILEVASASGSIDVVLLLLDALSTLDGFDDIWHKSLCEALEHDQQQAFSTLLDCVSSIGEAGEALKKKINHMNASGETLLLLACKAKKTRFIELLLSFDHVNPNLSGARRTPLMHALKENDLPVMHLLLKHPRILPDTVRVKKKTTPLIYAVKQGNMTAVAALLQHHKTNLNQADASGMTPLIMASELGHDKIVADLLHHPQIDPNQASDAADTPLYCASVQGHVGVVEKLLQHPDIRFQNNQKTECLAPKSANLRGLGEFAWAVYNNHIDVVDCFVKSEKILPSQIKRLCDFHVMEDILEIEKRKEYIQMRNFLTEVCSTS